MWDKERGHGLLPEFLGFFCGLVLSWVHQPTAILSSRTHAKKQSNVTSIATKLLGNTAEDMEIEKQSHEQEALSNTTTLEQHISLD